MLTHTEDEDNKLKGALHWQYRPRRTESSLGEEIVSYLKQRDQMLTKNAGVLDVWDEIIPPELAPHCCLDKRVGNTLYIQARPGAYMSRIQLLSGELLEKIRHFAPRCGIQKIRVIPLQKNNEE